MRERLLTVAESSRLTGFQKHWIRRLFYAGKITGRHDPETRQMFIDRESLEAYASQPRRALRPESVDASAQPVEKSA